MGRHSTAAFLSQTLSLIRQLRSRSAREAAGLHYVEGFRPFLWVVEAGIPIDRIVYSEVLARSPLVQKQVRLQRRAGVRVLRLTPEQFREVSASERASGVGVIVRQHWTGLRAANPRRGLCWVAAGRIRSPGNLGTLLRTAEAVGAGGMIFLGSGSDPFDPTVVRASMAGVFRMQLVRTGIGAFAGWCRRHGCAVIGTSPSAAALYTEVPLRRPLVILFGEERRGLTASELAVCTETARIPILGHADSLNVGVAAGVMLYEALRRGAVEGC